MAQWMIWKALVEHRSFGLELTPESTPSGTYSIGVNPESAPSDTDHYRRNPCDAEVRII